MDLLSSSSDGEDEDTLPKNRPENQTKEEGHHCAIDHHDIEMIESSDDDEEGGDNTSVALSRSQRTSLGNGSRKRPRPVASDAEIAKSLEREERVALKSRREAEEAAIDPSAPAELAKNLCTQLRLEYSAAAESGAGLGAFLNFDHACAFLSAHARELDRFEGVTGRRESKILVLYHGTQKKENLGKIMDTNLKVPDGRKVMQQTDDGFFGKGIYTSPNPGTSLAYAQGGGMFVCLALPGRQYPAVFPRDKGKPCQSFYDSHYAPGGSEIVFFDSSRLLPLYITSKESDLKHGVAAANAAIDTIAKATKNAKPRGPVLPEEPPIRIVRGRPGGGCRAERCWECRTGLCLGDYRSECWEYPAG
jgi:hypothetical protein